MKMQCNCYGDITRYTVNINEDTKVGQENVDDP